VNIIKHAIIILGLATALLAQQPQNWDHLGTILDKGTRHDSYIDPHTISPVGDIRSGKFTYQLKSTPCETCIDGLGYVINTMEVDLYHVKILMRTVTRYDQEGHQLTPTTDLTKPAFISADATLGGKPLSKELRAKLEAMGKGGEQWQDIPAGSLYELEYKYVRDFILRLLEDAREQQGGQ
jgi:hypothetical protein